MQKEEKKILGLTRKQREDILNEITDILDCFQAESSLLIGSGEEALDLAPAIIGVSYNKNEILYDYDKLVECFMQADGMSREDAEEHIDYNVFGSIQNNNSAVWPVIVYSVCVNKKESDDD